MKHRICSILLLTALVLSLCLTGCGKAEASASAAVSAQTETAAAAEAETAAETEVPQQLTITALNVGKADALLVQADGYTALIDTGEDTAAKTVLAALQQCGIDRLDLLLITHFDKDHVGGAAAVLKAVTADRILYPDYTGTTDAYTAFMQAISGSTAAEAVTAQCTLSLGGAALTVDPAEDPEEILDQKGEYDNDLSLVTRLTYGSRSFLFCGDIESTRIGQMLDTDTDWQCDWIKIPHHGVYEKSLKKLLEAAAPAYAVITDSEEEQADKKTLKLLEKADIDYAETADGIVVTTCDGETITMTTES